MFDLESINELASGNLSEKSYIKIIAGIAITAGRHNWPKTIVAPEANVSDFWTNEDVEDLAQQFFLWGYSTGKFEYLRNIPVDYRLYYFTQIFNSFVANRISEEQQKTGLSYDKCKKLVFEICKEKYFSKEINGIVFFSSNAFEDEDIKRGVDMSEALENLSHYVIPKDAKHFKPLVDIALEDIFNLIDSPINSSKLTKVVFGLFDQSFFHDPQAKETYQAEIVDKNRKKHQAIIQKLLAGLSKADAKIFSEYLPKSK